MRAVQPEIVDVIERRARANERPDDVRVAQVGGRDQGGTVVAARDVPRARSQRERDLESRAVVRDRGDRDDVVAVVLQGVRVRARRHERAHGAVMAPVRRDVQRRAPVRVPQVGPLPPSGQRFDGRASPREAAAKSPV